MVTKSEPFHCTVDPLTKSLPKTAMVVSGEPMYTLAGDTLVTVGTGWRAIVKLTAAEVPPPGPGVKTVICAVPCAETSPAKMAADR